MLQKALGDASQLDISMVRIHLPVDRSLVIIGLACEALISGAAFDWLHGLHPEMIGIGTQGVDCLFE